MTTTLISNNVSITVRANQVARLFYHEEFGKDIDSDINIMLSDNSLIRCMAKSGLKYSKAMSLLKDLGSKDKKKSAAASDELENVGVDVTDLLARSTGAKYGVPKLPSYDLMPVIWAMAKAEAYAQGVQDNFPATYRDWLIAKGDFDVNDCAEEFEAVIRKGFFRQGDGDGE